MNTTTKKAYDLISLLAPPKDAKQILRDLKNEKWICDQIKEEPGHLSFLFLDKQGQAHFYQINTANKAEVVVDGALRPGPK